MCVLVLLKSLLSESPCFRKSVSIKKIICTIPGGKIIQALLVGIGCLDFLGFSPIDLTLSLDFQGVGKT